MMNITFVTENLVIQQGKNIILTYYFYLNINVNIFPFFLANVVIGCLLYELKLYFIEFYLERKLKKNFFTLM